MLQRKLDKNLLAVGLQPPPPTLILRPKKNHSNNRNKGDEMRR